MSRLCKILLPAVFGLALLAPGAGAAPGLGAVSATNVQGVSALLEGTVNPQGMATTYWFEYGTVSNFAGAKKTATFPAGAGTGGELARAAISGLVPDTTYHYRLVAINSSGTATGSGGSGTASSFVTTHGFGIAEFSAAAIAEGGAVATTAGSHPYQLSFDVALNEGGEFEGQPGAIFPDGDVRDLRIEMPRGLIVNPSILPACDRAKFHTPRSSPFAASRSGESCPANTQVGTVKVSTSQGERTFGVFNLTAASGVLAQLGFAPFGAPVVLDIGLAPNPDGTYTLSLQARDMPQALDLYELGLELWGVPWDVSHNGQRGNCLNEAEPSFPWAKCSVGEQSVFPPRAFLSLPPACSGPLSFELSARAWQQPAPVATDAVNEAPGGGAAPLSCPPTQFSPKPVAHLDSTKASSPSGFVFRLEVNHNNLTAPNLVNATPPKTAFVILPEGSTLNPSVGAGLQVPRPAQFAAETVFSAEGSACPNAAKIGTLRARTPLFSDVLQGALYLAQPDDPATSAPGAENPFDSLLAVYMLAKSPQRGVMIKLAGELDPDPADGTLSASFDDLPQLPYTDLEVSFRSGQRSFLITPPRCGYVGTGVRVQPWGKAADVNLTSYTLIQSGVGGGPCPSGTPSFGPGVVAGGVNSNVNSYTPYFIRISRGDTEQEITSYSLQLPKGVTGKLAGIPYCPEAAIEAARHRRGFEEEANPSCPAASQVGRTYTGYGVGSALTYAAGRVYLAGPHNGAPLSLVTINPATVGPFDLGTIVIRSAFSVDPRTAQLELDSSRSDPIPHIIDGIVLHLRELRIHVDRFEFTHNPSSCSAAEMISTLTGSGARFEDSGDDPLVRSSTPFQLLNCRILGFKPRLGVRLRGATRRGGYPKIRATFAARGNRDSNLKDIAVVIPRQQFLAQEHIRGVCTRPQFEGGNCPKNSIYGNAVATTPLVDTPLRGKIYLRSSPGRVIPDLVADLYSGAVRVILEGRIGPTKRGGIRVFFSDLPDNPVKRFTMTLFGGKRGLLVNSADICKSPPISNVKALAQNNIGAVFTSKLRGQCNKKKTRTKKNRRHRRR